MGRAPTEDLEAYDLVLRGQDERKRTTREANVEARRLFVKARGAGVGRPAGGRHHVHPASDAPEPALSLLLVWTLGHAYYVARRNGDAVDAFNRVLQQNPNFLPAHAYLAVLFTEMGQAKRAQEAWDQARRLSPGASLAHLRQRLPYRRPADLDSFLTAVAKLP